ncbi:glycosyltransferase [Lysobacter sp. F6437]|uniref:glycosyltransferase n=1 Tax=Lysobacter sp. F6437 TaxID=3459296 RepID=UPI00403DB769
MAIAAALARVTVVVPVGPGDALSPALRAQLGSLPMETQVMEVLADAGAEEVAEAQATASSVARGPRWQVITAPRGRAPQQNAGARVADGEWLWFLHADCQLAPDALAALARFIDTQGAPGYFELRFLDDGPRLTRLNVVGAWIRSHWLGLPFGDQGLLVPRALFERVGGFDPELECGEDHQLVWRLRRVGAAMQPVGARLFTSARKYAERGWWATTRWHLTETWRQARRYSRQEAQ